MDDTYFYETNNIIVNSGMLNIIPIVVSAMTSLIIIQLVIAPMTDYY
jgi:hypothetical protein